MADDEAIDQKKHLEERCKPVCVKPLFEYRVLCKEKEIEKRGSFALGFAGSKGRIQGLLQPTSNLLQWLQACVERIRDDKTGHKHCTGQYFDYWSCVDKCVAVKLFKMLK